MNPIGVLHKEFNLPNLPMDNWSLQSLLTGIKRLSSLAFCWIIYTQLNLRTSLDASFRAASSVSVFGLLRKSLLLVNSPLSFDAFSHLLHSDSCSSLGSLGYYTVEQTQTIYGTGSLLTDSRKFPFTQLLLPIDRQIDRQTDRQTNR